MLKKKQKKVLWRIVIASIMTILLMINSHLGIIEIENEVLFLLFILS